jgi:hypothetical protein
MAIGVTKAVVDKHHGINDRLLYPLAFSAGQRLSIDNFTPVGM